MLEIKNLSLDYKDGNESRNVLNNINYKFDSKKFYAILGPSGSGKSSLIYLLSLLRNPTKGNIFIDKVDVTNNKKKDQIRYKKFGFIFQQNFLISHLSVLENVCVANYNSKAIEKEAIKILTELGLEEHINKAPYQLSGGQKQRVSIARALVKKPEYIFADEPTASLDHDNAVKVMNLLEHYSTQSTIICATHDLSVLPTNCVKLNLNNGKIS